MSIYPKLVVATAASLAVATALCSSPVALLGSIIAGVVALALRASPRVEQLLGFLVGTLALLLPRWGWGGGTLLLLVVGAVLISRRGRKQPLREPGMTELMGAWGAWIFLLGAWTVLLATYSLSWTALPTILVQGETWVVPLVAIQEYISLIRPEWSWALMTTARFAALLLWFMVLRDSIELRAGYLKGITVALVIAALAALGQATKAYLPVEFGTPLAALERSFWSGQHRYPGLLTDPNALAIVLALMLPFAAMGVMRQQHGRWWRFFCIPLFIAGAVVTGSRTFVLMLCCYGFLGLWRYSRRLSINIVVAAVIVIAGWNIALLYDQGIEERIVSSTPSTVSRLVRSVSAGSLSEAIFSRTVFWKMALQAWQDNPVVGMGPDQFRLSSLEYSSRVGADIGLWVDNPNSFYLGLLAEVGVIGILVLGGALRWLTITSPSSDSHASAAHLALFAFACALLFGPHQEFDEVCAVLALIGAYAVEPRPGETRSRMTAFSGWGLAVLAIPLIFASMYHRPFGFYSWERDDGGFYRWTMPTAVEVRRCERGKPVRIALRAIVPPGLGTLHVSLRETTGNAAREFDFTNTDEREIMLTCPGSVRSSDSSPYGEIRYEVRSSPAWRPRDFAMGADPRIFGVQIRDGLPPPE